MTGTPDCHCTMVMPGADAAALFVELDFAERIIFRGAGIHGPQRIGDRNAVGLAGLLERVLDHPHVAIGGDRVLRHPGLLVAGLEFGDQRLVALGAPAGDAGEHALQQFRADGLQHVGFGDGDAERDGRNLALSEAELVHLLEQQLGVGNHGRQEEQQVRFRRPDFLNQRGGVGERRRKGFVDDQLQPVFGEQAVAHRLGRGDRCRGVVGDDRDRLGLLAGSGFRQLHDLRQRLSCLRPCRCRGLEDIFEAAIGDQVGVGEGEDRQDWPAR